MNDFLAMITGYFCASAPTDGVGAAQVQDPDPLDDAEIEKFD